MEIERTVIEIQDMLRRVIFQIDSTPVTDLFGASKAEEIEIMTSHRAILESAIQGHASTWPPVLMLFEQSCLGWLGGREWDKYPEIEKDEDGIWHMK